MGLTPEQQELIRANRERALEIQRKQKENAEKIKREREQKDQKEEPDTKRQKQAAAKGEEDSLESIVLEDFEETASEWVTKKEAMKMYCLPEGTLAVCEFVEKENPHQKTWAKMKMYNRSEIRRRARKRHGGLEGLIEERKNREEKRFAKDMERAKEIFKK
jgi:hypothetical protein